MAVLLLGAWCDGSTGVAGRAPPRVSRNAHQPERPLQGCSLAYLRNTGPVPHRHFHPGRPDGGGSSGMSRPLSHVTSLSHQTRLTSHHSWRQKCLGTTSGTTAPAAAIRARPPKTCSTPWTRSATTSCALRWVMCLGHNVSITALGMQAGTEAESRCHVNLSEQARRGVYSTATQLGLKCCISKHDHAHVLHTSRIHREVCTRD